MAKRERQEHNSYRPQANEPCFSANIPTTPNHQRSRPIPIKRRKLFEKEGTRSGSNSNNNSPEQPQQHGNNSMCLMVGEEFRKLDASIPEEDRRILQRQRAVLKGKNTVGYDEYTAKVPKERRTIRHPRTPDHTIDIPNRRWLGLVKSWRIALHKYDPEELQTEFKSQNEKDDKKMADKSNNKEDTDSNKKHPLKSLTVQERQIADASTKGLLVDFGTGVADAASSIERKVDGKEEIGEGFPVDGDGAMEELDKLEANDDDEDFLDYDDSDDDLL